jgi:hypothetical protein
LLDDGRIRKAQKLTDPADLDPEQWKVERRKEKEKCLGERP